MKSWWGDPSKVLKADYFQEKQKEFRAYRYNIYILHKVVLRKYVGCFKDSALVFL
jgi:hypothetical protein